MFSLTSLKCFAAAAEELNFTRAAKRLFISQQALSSHISKLEEYYGVRLFDRGIPMTLTDAGRALQKHAREILSSVDDYAREVQDIKNFRQGELTVGIPVTRGSIWWRGPSAGTSRMRCTMAQPTCASAISPKTRRSWR